MLSLDEFLTETKTDIMPQRSYVTEPGWNTLYVRHTWHYVEGTMRRTIDLATIEAEKPGNGTFKILVSKLCILYPQEIIYVESVQSTRFAQGLIRMGFKQIDDLPNYYMLPK